jgi:transposase
LAELDADSSKGQPPVAPAQLALALILQAYTGASDDEVIEATVMDRRWQLVLDCLDAEQPPFSKGTVFNFGTRLIQADLDRRLVERPWRWRRARPRAGSFGRRWIPVRCGGWPGGGHRQLDGTRPGQGLGGDRAPAGVGLAEGPRCWPNRQAPGCWPPPA